MKNNKKLISFIGQKKIVDELLAIYNNIKSTQHGINILFSGFAGCGKTKLAYDFLSLFGDFGVQYPTTKNKFLVFWDSRCDTFRGLFFDEIHLYKNIESLYPYMDKKNKILVFATNILDLPDAFTSRCFQFIFSDYSEEEIAKIILKYSIYKKFPIAVSIAELLATFSRGSPRTAKNIFDRSLFIINCGYYSKTLTGFSSALKDIGVYSGGFTDLDIRYLKILQTNRYMSLDNLSRILKVNKYTIINDIEPFLISKNKIQITSKGRCLI